MLNYNSMQNSNPMNQQKKQPKINRPTGGASGTQASNSNTPAIKGVSSYVNPATQSQGSLTDALGGTQPYPTMLNMGMPDMGIPTTNQLPSSSMPSSPGTPNVPTTGQMPTTGQVSPFNPNTPVSNIPQPSQSPYQPTVPTTSTWDNAAQAGQSPYQPIDTSGYQQPGTISPFNPNVPLPNIPGNQGTQPSAPTGGSQQQQPDAPSGMSAMDEFRESAALGFGDETAQTPQDGGSTAGSGFSGFPSLSSQDSGTLNDWLKTLGERSGRIADLPPNIRRIMDGIDRAYRENGVGDGIYGANGTWKLAASNLYSGGAGMPGEMEGSLDTPQDMPEEGMQQPGQTPQDAPEPSQDTSPPQAPQGVPEPSQDTSPPQAPTQQAPAGQASAQPIVSGVHALRQPAAAQSGDGFFTRIGGGDQAGTRMDNIIGKDGTIHWSTKIKTSNPDALPQPQAGRKWALVGDGLYAQVPQDSQIKPGKQFHDFPWVQDGLMVQWNAGSAPAAQAQPAAPADTGSTDTGGLTIGPGAETGQPDAPSLPDTRAPQAPGRTAEETPSPGTDTGLVPALGGAQQEVPPREADTGAARLPTMEEVAETLPAGQAAQPIVDIVRGVQQPTPDANVTTPVAETAGANQTGRTEAPAAEARVAQGPEQQAEAPSFGQEGYAASVRERQAQQAEAEQQQQAQAQSVASPADRLKSIPIRDQIAAKERYGQYVNELPAGSRKVGTYSGRDVHMTEDGVLMMKRGEGRFEAFSPYSTLTKEVKSGQFRNPQAWVPAEDAQPAEQEQKPVSALDEFKQQVQAGAVSEVPAEQAEVPAQQAEVPAELTVMPDEQAEFPADLERRTEQVKQFASLKPEEMPQGFKHVGWTDDGYMVWEKGNRRFIGRVEEDTRASAKEYVWTKNRKRHSIQEYIGSVPLGWKHKKNHDLFLGDNGRSIYKWDAERNELQRLVNANDKEFIKSKVDRYRGTAGYSNEPITDAAKDIINTLKPGKRVQWGNFTSEYTPLSNENRNEIQAARGKTTLENAISQEGNYSSRFSFLEGVKFDDDSKWRNVDLKNLLPEKVRNRQGLTDEDIKYLYTDPRTGGQEVFTGKDLNDLARMGLNRKDLIDGLRLLRDESGENLIFPPDKSIPGKFQRTAEIVGDIRRAEPENKWDNVEFTRLIDPNKTYKYQDPVTGGISPQSGRDILTLASMGLNKDMLTDSMRMLRNEDGSLVFPPNQPIANEFKTVQERPEPEKKFEDLVEQYNRGDFGEVPEEQLIRPEVPQRPEEEETLPTSTDTAATTSALDEFKQQVEAGAVSEEGQADRPSLSLDSLESIPMSERQAAFERYPQYSDNLPEGSKMVGTYDGQDLHLTPDGVLMRRESWRGAQRFQAFSPNAQLMKWIKQGDEKFVPGDTPTYKDPEVVKQEKQQRKDELAAIKQSEPEGKWSDIDNDMVQMGGKSVDWRTLIDPEKIYNFIDPVVHTVTPSPGQSILQLAGGLQGGMKTDILRALQNEDGTRVFAEDASAAPQAAQPATAMDEFKQQVEAGAVSDVSVANKAARANLFDAIQGEDGQLYSNSNLTFPVTTAIRSNDGVLNRRALQQGIADYENFSGEVWDRYQQTLPQDAKDASNQVLASNAALRNLVFSLDKYDVNKEISLVGNNPNATLSGDTNYISHPAAKIHVYDAIERSVERGGYELPSSKESLKNFAFTTDNGTQMVPVWLGTRGSKITNQEYQRMVAIPLEKAEAEWDLIFGNGRPQDINSHIFTKQGFSALSAVPPSNLTEQDKQQLEQFMAGDLDENLYSHARANPTTGTYNTNAFGKSDFTRYHTKGYINGEPIVQTRKVNPNGFGNLPADIMPQQQVREDRSAAPGSPLARLESIASGATEIPEISQPGEQAAATEVPQSTWDNAAQSGFHGLTPEQLAEIRERNRQKQAEQPEQTPERRSDAIAEMEQGLVEEGVFDEDKPVEEQPAADVVPQETAEMQQARDDYAKNIVGRFQGNPVIVEDGKVFMEQNGERVSLPDSPLSQYVMAMTEMKNPADAGINQRYLNQIRSQFEPAGSFSKAMHGVDMNLPEGFRSGGMLSEDQRIRQDRLRGEQRQQEQAEQIANFTLNPLDKQVADYQRFQQERDDAIAQLMGTDVGNNVGQYIRNLYAQAEEVGRAHQRDDIPAAEAFNQQKALMDKARALQDAQKINADKLEKYKSIFVTGEPVQDEYYEQWRAKRDAPAEGSPLGRLQQITSGINPDTGEAIRPTIEERPDPERPVIEERPAEKPALEEFADKVEAGEVSDPEVGQPQPEPVDSTPPTQWSDGDRRELVRPLPPQPPASIPNWQAPESAPISAAPTPSEVETTPVVENAGDNQAGRPTDTGLPGAPDPDDIPRDRYKGMDSRLAEENRRIDSLNDMQKSRNMRIAEDKVRSGEWRLQERSRMYGDVDRWVDNATGQTYNIADVGDFIRSSLEAEANRRQENPGQPEGVKPALEEFAEQVEAGAVSDPNIGQQVPIGGRQEVGATADQRRAAATQGLNKAVESGMFEALPRPGGRGLPTVQEYRNKQTGEVYTESQALDFFENQIFKDNQPKLEGPPELEAISAAPPVTSPGLERPTVVEPQDPNPVADAELEQVLQDGNLPGQGQQEPGITTGEYQEPISEVFPPEDTAPGDDGFVPSWEQGPRQYFRAGQYTPEQQDLRNQYRDMLGNWINQMPQAPGGLINPMQLMLQGMMGGMSGQFNPINPNIGNFYNPFMGLNLIGSLLGGGGLQGGMQDRWNVQPEFLGDTSYTTDSSDVTGAESNMGFAPEGAVSIAPQQDDPPATSDDDEPLTELPDPSTDIRDIVGTDNMIDVSPGFTREELTRRDVSPAQVQAMANQAAAQARQRGYEQSLRAGMPGRGRSADAGTFSQFGAGPLAQSLLQAQQAQIAIPFEQQMAYNQARRQREQTAHQLGLAQSGLIGQDYYRRAYDQLADQQMRSQLMQALLNPLLGGLFF